jgi:hypothetical protein
MVTSGEKSGKKRGVSIALITSTPLDSNLSYLPLTIEFISFALPKILHKRHARVPKQAGVPVCRRLTIESQTLFESQIIIERLGTFLAQGESQA